MKYKRIEPGHYQSEDGRVTIRKEVYHNFTGKRHVKETVWHVVIDGKELHNCEMSKKDAIETAERKLKEVK